MKCIHCGAPTEVRETRDAGVACNRRVRVCFNGHIFRTLEVPPGSVSLKDLAQAQEGVAQRTLSFERARRVLREPTLRATDLARMLGITEARVRQIRAKAKPQ